MRLIKHIITIICIFISINVTSAQSWEAGLGIQKLNIGGTEISYNGSYSTKEVESSLMFFYVSTGINIPFYNFFNEYSIGTQLNILVGTGIASNGDGPALPSFNFGLPAYLTFRAGAGANRNSTFPLGIGLGLGYQFSGFIADNSNFNPDDSGINFYARPSIMIDLTIDFGNSSSFLDNSKLRFETMLCAFKQQKQYNQYNIDYGYTFIHSSITYIFFF